MVSISWWISWSIQNWISNKWWRAILWKCESSIRSSPCKFSYQLKVILIFRFSIKRKKNRFRSRDYPAESNLRRKKIKNPFHSLSLFFQEIHFDNRMQNKRLKFMVKYGFLMVLYLVDIKNHTLNTINSTFIHHTNINFKSLNLIL